MDTASPWTSHLRLQASRVLPGSATLRIFTNLHEADDPAFWPCCCIGIEFIALMNRPQPSLLARLLRAMADRLLLLDRVL